MRVRRSSTRIPEPRQTLILFPITRRCLYQILIVCNFMQPYTQWCQGTIMLASACEPHLIDISKNESKGPAFVSLNPNGRIPAIIDPAGPDGGKPIAVWNPVDPSISPTRRASSFQMRANRYKTWPGCLSRCRHRADVRSARFLPAIWRQKTLRTTSGPSKGFVDESKRLLGVLDPPAEGRNWMVGDYSIADTRPRLGKCAG